MLQCLWRVAFASLQQGAYLFIAQFRGRIPFAVGGLFSGTAEARFATFRYLVVRQRRLADRAACSSKRLEIHLSEGHLTREVCSAGVPLPDHRTCPKSTQASPPRMSPTPSEIANPMPCKGNHSTPTASVTALEEGLSTSAPEAAMPSANKPIRMPRNATV